MYQGFPLDLLSLLRCPRDSAMLHQVGESEGKTHIWQGTLQCERCRHEYPVTDGIVRLFDATQLDKVSEHEHQRRDEGAGRDNFSWETSVTSRMEVVPTLQSLRPLRDALVLELGCGKGRFTTLMAQDGATVLAVDFSLAVLKRLAARVQPSWRIGLVQADCARQMAAPRRFSRVLSTLVSNLPSSEHRRGMFNVAADALKADGRFVFNAHHHGFREWLFKTPQAGHYPESGIFRYLFRRGELLDECAQHFENVHCRPIQVTFPLSARLGLQSVTFSRLAERVPLLNQFGALLLAVAKKPREDLVH